MCAHQRISKKNSEHGIVVKMVVELKIDFDYYT